MEWKWVWLALLLVVIAAAVWLLLRRPGGSEGVSGQDTSTLPAGTDADAIPPSQAGGYAPGVANDPGAPYDQQPGAGAYDQGAGAPYDQQPGAGAPYDQQPGAGAYDQGAGASYDEQSAASYDETTGQEPAPFDQSAAATGEPYAHPATVDPVTTDDTMDPAAADPTYGSQTDGTYQDAPPEADYAASAQDVVYEQGTPTDTGTGYAEPAQDVTYEQSGSYRDTATGESVEADPYFETPAPDDGHGAVYDQGNGDATPGATPESDTGYHDGAITDTSYESAPETDSGYAAPGTDTAYESAPETDSGYAAPGTDTSYESAPETDSGYAAPEVDSGLATAGTDTSYGDGGEFEEAQATDEPLAEAPVAEQQATADDYGYDEAQAGAAAGSYGQGPFGPGSAEPAEDGSGPVGWSIKGNAGSMLFHTTDSPSYEAARAEVWFESEEAAKAAGFAHWDRKQR